MQSTAIVAPKTSRAIGTSAVAIGGYTPSGATGAIISSLIVANISGASANVTVDVFDGTNATRLVLAQPLAVADCLNLGGILSKFVLVNGWTIRVTSSVAASLDATMCVVEFT